MWDFAYTKQEDFAKRNFGDFVHLYGVGGALGASVDMLKFVSFPDIPERSTNLLNRSVFAGFNAALTITELRLVGDIKGKPGKPKNQSTKLGVTFTKWLYNFGMF